MAASYGRMHLLPRDGPRPDAASSTEIAIDCRRRATTPSTSTSSATASATSRSTRPTARSTSPRTSVVEVDARRARAVAVRRARRGRRSATRSGRDGRRTRSTPMHFVLDSPLVAGVRALPPTPSRRSARAGRSLDAVAGPLVAHPRATSTTTPARPTVDTPARRGARRAQGRLPGLRPRRASAACARSGSPPATSAATSRPTRRPGGRSWSAPTCPTPGFGVLPPGGGLARRRPHERPARRTALRRHGAGAATTPTCRPIKGVIFTEGRVEPSDGRRSTWLPSG